MSDVPGVDGAPGRHSDIDMPAAQQREPRPVNGAPSCSDQGRSAQETVTVLTSTQRKYATKRFSRKTDGSIQNRSYGNETWFTVESVTVGGIEDLAQTLGQLVSNPYAFWVRGEPLPGINRKRSRRLLYDKKKTGDVATFREQRRHAFVVDIDHIPCPAAIDPKGDPEGAVEYALGLLPAELWDATCWWQFSSSQSVFGDDTLSLHLCFWNLAALADAELKRWATATNIAAGYKLVDPALYRPVQPHYIAAPIFDGVTDPLPRRYGLRKGLDDVVSLLIPEPDPKRPDEPLGQGFEPGAGVDGYLAELGGPRGFLAPIRAAIASYIAIHGTAADAEPVKQAIRATIAHADRGARGAEAIERYQSDEFLDGIIEWVREQHGDRPPKGFIGEPPDYVVDPEIPIDADGSGSEDYQRLIKKFNAKYAVVNETGKAVIYEQVYDSMLERKVLIRITFADLRKFYQNRLLTIGKVTNTEANWWLESPQRRQYLGGVVFDPTGNAPADCWNLWSEFAVEPKEGDWSLMRNHILNVICGGDTDSFDYMLNWTARMFQQPHQQGEVAVSVKGLKGVGKGIFFHCLRKAWGQHGVYISNAAHLVGNFNAHLRDCVFLFADEAFFAGDRQHESVLKALITDPVLPIEGKYQNVVNVKNMLHVGMASNAEWVVPASHDERRYFAQNATDDHRGDRSYFAAMAAQMGNGGLAAMIYEMLHRDITEFDVGVVPQTDALAEQKRLSLDTLDRWWLAVLERGFVWRSRHGVEEFTVWRDFDATELLDRSYQQWCADHRISRPMSRELLGKRMTEIYGLPTRPSAPAIIGETESAALLERQDGAVINKDELIQWQNSARGYGVGSRQEAAEKFAKIRHVSVEIS